MAANIHSDESYKWSAASKVKVSEDELANEKSSMIYIVERKLQPYSKEDMKIISQPSDPLVIVATYSFNQQEGRIKLYVKIHNTSMVDIFQTSVEIATDGPFTLFDNNNRQPVEMIGDFQTGNICHIEREYILSKFRYSVFLVTVYFSTQRKALDSDLLSKSETRADGSLISVRCQPLQVKPFHFLITPKRLLHEDFLTLWESYWSYLDLLFFLETNLLLFIDLTVRSIEKPSSPLNWTKSLPLKRSCLNLHSP